MDVSNVGNQGKPKVKSVGPLFDLGERVGKLGKVKKNKERGDIWETHGTFAIFLLKKLEKGADQG
jgi:hypothetical protein